MSAHPIQAGGYDLQSYGSLEALIEAHRNNISPESSKKLAQVAPHLSQARDLHNQHAYHADDAPGPSFASLIKDLPKEVLDPAEQSLLLDTDATTLVDKLKSGEFSAERVVRAAIARTQVAQEVLGCCIEIIQAEAISRAKELDRKREAGGPLGALHGLPISIKGHISLQGTTNCRGYVIDCLSPSSLANLDLKNTPHASLISPASVGKYVADSTAPLVQALLHAGAIVIAKTTMPQTVMHLDTTNNLYGQTLNPYNLALSPGGSSGGESALVASGASLLGLGTDIGGSIRQPCAVTGLFGFRPSCDRLPMAGYRNSSPGNIGVGPSTGPMARSLADVNLFMRTVLAPGALDGKRSLWDVDHSLRPEPWRDAASSAPYKKLVVGVLYDDKVVRPAAPVRRALAAFVEKLSACKDVTVKTVEPFGDHKKSFDLVRRLYFLDGGAQSSAYMSATGEEPLPLTQFILSPPHVKNHSASELFGAMVERETYKAAYWKTWEESGIDVLLCPATPGVANRPQTIKYWGYTSHWNLLDYPGLVMPTGIVADAAVDSAFDKQDRAHPNTYGEDDETFSKEYENHRAVFDGAPVGLQLIGKRDEELLEAAALVCRVCLQ